MPSDAEVYGLARWLHEQYEEIAADVGWDTQEGTSVDFDELPHKNRDVMIRMAMRLFAEAQKDADGIPAFVGDDDAADDTVEIALYGNDDPSGGCVNYWPVWGQDVPQRGDRIRLSDGEWTVTHRVFKPGEPVEVYAEPPEGARGKS